MVEEPKFIEVREQERYLYEFYEAKPGNPSAVNISPELFERLEKYEEEHNEIQEILYRLFWGKDSELE